MNALSFRVQCYVLVPTIFAGFTALAALLTYQLMHYPPTLLAGWRWPLAVSGAVLAVTAFLTGLLIIWLLLKPVEQFVARANTMMAAPAAEPVPSISRTALSGMTPIVQALERVTQVLGTVEARALFPEIVAPSPAMRALLGLVMKIAPTDATVLLLGESGTGKELIAKAIHARSKRADKPFVAINCAGIPEGLLESELFGHEKGSFTGAHARKIGKFEAATGGTVFLDELADMPMITQAKILRALQEREIERVGSSQTIPIDIRVIAATNKDLLRMVTDGTFREDLYFRIHVFSIQLPPLRERSEDIPQIAMQLLRQIKPETRIAPMALAALTAHAWPGNVRELRNVIEAAATLADGVIDHEHLGFNMGAGETGVRSGFASRTGRHGDDLDQRLRAIEKGLIIEALNRTGGVQVKAAQMLGIKERSLWHRIAKFDIDINTLRNREPVNETSIPQYV